MPKIRIDSADRQRHAGDRPDEIEDAGRQRQQHVEQRGIRARIGGDAEETSERGRALRLRRRTQRLLHLFFLVDVDAGDFFGRAVARRDFRQYLGFGFAGILGQLGAQMILGVVQRILDQRRIGAAQRDAQLIEIFRDGARQRVHDPSSTVLTKSRVAVQRSVHSSSTRRPSGVMR